MKKMNLIILTYMYIFRMTNICDKYAPQTINDIVGCKKQITELLTWLKNFNTQIKIKKNKVKEYSSCAYVSGDHGVGKTTLVNVCLKHAGYQVRNISFTNALIEDISDILTQNTIYNNKPYVYVIDEIETITSTNEKNGISEIIKNNTINRHCPIIFIGSNKHKKFNILLKKECFNIILYKPTINEMCKVLENICINEKMKLEGVDVVETIIKHSQEDYRRLIIILGELLRSYGMKTITKTHIDNYILFSTEKNTDISIFDNTIHLFSHYSNINETLKIYNSDKINIPLMVHQNHFTTNSYVKTKTLTEKLELSYDITSSLSKGDVIDNFIYSEQIWALQDTYCFYSCTYPSYKINNNINTKQLIHDTINPYYKPKFTTQYPKDPNRTSTKCINKKKNMDLANEYFSNMSIDGYIIIVKLIKKLLDNDQIDKCKQILQSYNIPYTYLTHIFKMDKINGTRMDIPKILDNKLKYISFDTIKQMIIIKKSK